MSCRSTSLLDGVVSVFKHLIDKSFVELNRLLNLTNQSFEVEMESLIKFRLILCDFNLSYLIFSTRGNLTVTGAPKASETISSAAFTSRMIEFGK